MGKKSATRGLEDNEARAIIRNLRISPQKLNLIAEQIRGKPVQKALMDLEFSRRRISDAVKTGLESAIANAENNHQLDVDRLIVSEATVGKAFVMKRWRARARGRVAPIQKPFSQITLVVREQEEA